MNTHPLVAVAVVAVLTGALGIYQWIELVHVQQGGKALCAINATLNCAAVWDAPFAKAIQSATKVPIAGWGVVWGLVAIAVSIVVLRNARAKRSIEVETAALRLVAIAGVGASIVFAGISASMGVWCLTCLMTYTLAITFAVLAFKGTSKPPASAWSKGLVRAGTFVAAGYLLVLYPGTLTPVGAMTSGIVKKDPLKKDPTHTTAPQKGTGDLLSDFLIQLPDATRSAVSEALAAYKKETPMGLGSAYPARRVLGPPDAPVKIVEFSDIRCGHCKTFSAALTEIEQNAPTGIFNLDLRTFPLDPTCNPNVLNMQMKDETGVRCTAARGLICVEMSNGFRHAQEQMFMEQERLTLERVIEILTSASGMSRDELQRCVNSPDTAAKLKNDIGYAMAYKIEGTPLVTINGKRAMAIGPFVYAMILANGDPNAPGWRVLPPAEG